MLWTCGKQVSNCCSLTDLAFFSAAIREVPLTFCRVGNTMEFRTTTQTITVLIRSRSRKDDYALLQCGAAIQQEHLVAFRVQGGGDAAALSIDPTEFLSGKALTRCFYKKSPHKESAELGEGTDVNMGLLPAFGGKVSKHKHLLLYEARGFCGATGCAALLSYEGEVVGMHLAVAGSSQLRVALLCHVFT